MIRGSDMTSQQRKREGRAPHGTVFMRPLDKGERITLCSQAEVDRLCGTYRALSEMDDSLRPLIRQEGSVKGRSI